MWPLKHAGLALASSLSAYVNLAGLCWILSRRHGLLGAPGLLSSLARTGAASAALFAWCAWMAWTLGGPRGTGAMLVTLASGVVLYGAVAAALRAPELGALIRVLRRRDPGLPSRGPE
jgi:putative peptidoglycan lipid II flippase